MVIDKLENFGKYVELNPLFKQAAEFLATHDLATLELGKIELQGKDLYVNVAQGRPKTKEQSRLETHKYGIDIQIPVSDSELMGYTPTEDLPEAPYNAEKDATYYEGLAESYILVKPGMFAIFFPQDGHAPGVNPVGLKRVVLKVKA